MSAFTHNRDCFYKYTDAPGAIKILRGCAALCRCPVEFNDPFDGQMGLSFDFQDDELHAALLRVANRVVFESPDSALLPNNWGSVGVELMRKWPAPVANRQEFLANIFPPENYSPARLEQVFNEKVAVPRNALMRKLRLFCVSESLHNLLLWSHYAASHTGVVIELRCLRDKNTFLCAAQPVMYSSIVPAAFTAEEWAEAILGIRDPVPKSLIEKEYFTKSSEWAYEREWRVILDADVVDDRNLTPLLPEEISSIYFGCCTSDALVREVGQLVSSRYPHAKMFRANKARHRFALEFSPINND